MTAQETAYFLARETTDYFIVDFFLHKICDKIHHKDQSERIYWMEVREEWDRIKMYE